jgi:hypothetical protein
MRVSYANEGLFALVSQVFCWATSGSAPPLALVEMTAGSSSSLRLWMQKGWYKLLIGSDFWSWSHALGSKWPMLYEGSPAAWLTVLQPGHWRTA